MRSLSSKKGQASQAALSGLIKNEKMKDLKNIYALNFKSKSSHAQGRLPNEGASSKLNYSRMAYVSLPEDPED